MDPSARVCPFCGDRPGPGMFCEACGRSLADVDRLPTAEEWSAGRVPPGAPHAPPDPAGAAAATEAFLAAMHAAGDPGATEIATAKRSGFRRAPRLRGWIVRPVDREDFGQRRYEPGLVLTVEGRFHRLDSELRGWGQRDFPHYAHSASVDPVDPPDDARLADELAAVLAANGVAGG